MPSGGTGSTGRDGSERARLELVEAHVRAENRHDLEAVMATFGDAPRYEDAPWRERHDGRDGVREYYETLLGALPDLHVDVSRRHVTGEDVILEVVVSGTHTDTWRGFPGTGRRVEFPLCAIYTFDDRGKLAGERIYYDRATLLGQLGLFHEPLHGLGRVLTPITHPITTGRAVARAIRTR